jgi:hypothetical protein
MNPNIADSSIPAVEPGAEDVVVDVIPIGLEIVDVSLEATEG